MPIDPEGGKLLRGLEMRMRDFESDRRFANPLGRLRRQARWIGAGTALCGLAALIISLLMPKIYRATTYVLVSESKIGATPTAPSWQYSLLPTYVPFVDNDELLAQTIQHFNLDQPPYSLTPHRFRTRDYLDVNIPKATRLLEISVEFPDAKLAAGLANYLAQRAAEFNTRLNAQDTESSQAFLKQRVDHAATHLAETEATLLRVRERAQIEDQEKALSILLAQKERAAGELQQLTLELSKDQSRAGSLQKALAQEPRTIQLKKSLSADRTLQRAADKLGLDSRGTLSTTEEALNATHEELDQQLAAANADVAAEKAGVDTASKSLAKVDGRIQSLLCNLTRLRAEIDKADRDFSLAKEAYEASSRDYRNASVTVSAKSQDLKQVAPALVPEKPVRPRIILNVILAVLFGATLLSMIALARESYRELRAEEAPLMPENETVGVRHS
jgi:succinoglycan biosynthesis transport protein ExoP